MVAAAGDSKGFDLQKLNKFSKSEILDPLVQEEKNLAAQLREGLSKLLDMHNPAELGSLCGAMGLVEECEFGTHAEKKAGVLRKVAQTGTQPVHRRTSVVSPWQRKGTVLALDPFRSGPRRRSTKITKLLIPNS